MFEALISVVGWGLRRLRWRSFALRKGRLRAVAQGPDAATIGADVKERHLALITNTIRQFPSSETTALLTVRKGRALEALADPAAGKNSQAAFTRAGEDAMVICHARNHKFVPRTAVQRRREPC